jgi:hypothetical protein
MTWTKQSFSAQLLMYIRYDVFGHSTATGPTLEEAPTDVVSELSVFSADLLQL